MLRGVSESARRFTQAFAYVPDAGTLLAGGDRTYRLANLVAEGGEGRVFQVADRDDIVAKVYKEYDLSRRAKLALMIDRSTRGLRKVAAWPISALNNSTDETVGFVMESLIGWQPLHNAYQIRSRLKLFPHQDYRFLVRAARNLATCVHHVHEEGMVIGDLNESNVFVNSKAMAKLIDADSFQIAGPTALYACKVGKPELLPPELQRHSLEGLVRTAEHDRFALAALIFQTLVFGRHPFAGTVDHQIDLPLETCIEHGYYAYTSRRSIPIKPPPFLSLHWLPENIRDLFEDAFDPRNQDRPTAKTWYFALKDLEAHLRTCPENPSHQYWSGVHSCPWCELEDRWRIALFRPALSDPDQEYEVTEMLDRIASIAPPTMSGRDLLDFDYRTLQPAKLTVWESFFGKASKNWGWFIFAFFQLITMFSDLHHHVAYMLMFAALVLTLVVFGIVYSRSEVMVRRATKRLGSLAEQWKREADTTLFAEMQERYENLAAQLKDVKGTFERKRQDYIADLHHPELLKYLTKYQVLIANAGSLGSDSLSYLFDNGIKSAADITDENLNTLPRVLKNRERDDLKAWRSTLERQFWKSHNYKLTMHQERKLIVDTRKENDLRKKELEQAPAELQSLVERLSDRQAALTNEAEKYVSVLQRHGPKLLALEGKRPSG